MKKVLILNGSNTGTTMYLAQKIVEENNNKVKGEELDLKIMANYGLSDTIKTFVNKVVVNFLLDFFIFDSVKFTI